jgi:peptidoglycan-N-acetylglucosamine deacetylase
VRGLGYSSQVSAVALTFDDGPDPVWTPALLDLLCECSARVTFFPIASRAAAHPELIARMRAEGHHVGLHCDEHIRHSDRDIGWLRRDTRQALERLARIGVAPLLWRPPWGDTAAWSSRVARECGLQLVGWTVDTHDWRGDSAREMFTVTQPALDTGATVLAHDGLGPGAQRRGAAETLDYVRLVAAEASRRGLVLDSMA